MWRPLSPKWSKLQGEPLLSFSTVGETLSAWWAEAEDHQLYSVGIWCLWAVPIYSQRSQRQDKYHPTHVACCESLVLAGFMRAMQRLWFWSRQWISHCSAVCYYRNPYMKIKSIIYNMVVHYTVDDSESHDTEAVQFRYSSNGSEDGAVLRSMYVLKQQDGENTTSWYCLANIVR